MAMAFLQISHNLWLICAATPCAPPALDLQASCRASITPDRVSQPLRSVNRPIGTAAPLSPQKPRFAVARPILDIFLDFCLSCDSLEIASFRG